MYVFLRLLILGLHFIFFILKIMKNSYQVHFSHLSLMNMWFYFHLPKLFFILIDLMQLALWLSRWGTRQYSTPTGCCASARISVCYQSVYWTWHLQLCVLGSHQTHHHHQWPTSLCYQTHNTYVSPLACLHGTEMPEADWVGFTSGKIEVWEWLSSLI